jgi:UDPglucose--hexose-1-phosphate uridylyltransferase
MDFNRPHRRFNPLTGQWVLVSPHRGSRPWLGQLERPAQDQLPEYDPACYLCPGNVRANGMHNPAYGGTFVFDNDFSALLPPDGTHEQPQSGIFSAEPETGASRVVCFSPRHDLTLPELSLGQVEQVVETWCRETDLLARRPGVRYVQVFENKGAAMGCSNPHPHSQIWAQGHIPNEPAMELGRLAQYYEGQGRCLLCDTLQAERQAGQRIVAQNEHFTALVPFWAVWPFEVLLLANRHFDGLADLETGEVAGLADVMRQVTIRYDNLFEVSFPYSMGLHQAPCDGQAHPGQHFHAHYYPPLLRSATVRKFMVGYEMLAMPQRDLTPETAAARLNSLPGVHYKQR